MLTDSAAGHPAWLPCAGSPVDELEGCAQSRAGDAPAVQLNLREDPENSRLEITKEFVLESSSNELARRN
jgi:hypothetical protein